MHENKHFQEIKILVHGLGPMHEKKIRNYISAASSGAIVDCGIHIGAMIGTIMDSGDHVGAVTGAKMDWTVHIGAATGSKWSVRSIFDIPA